MTLSKLKNSGRVLLFICLSNPLPVFAGGIHEAIRAGQLDEVIQFVHAGQPAQVLRQVNAPDETGEWPLDLAARLGNPKIVTELLRAGALSNPIHFLTRSRSDSSFLTPRRFEDQTLDAIKKRLFLVHTLPALPTDGVLKADFANRGIHISKEAFFKLGRDGAQDSIAIKAPWLASIHLTINHHVASDHYTTPRQDKDRAFTVIVPVYQKDSRVDPLRQIVSASFPEVVLVGNYRLPQNTTILVRKDRREEIPAHYAHFDIVEYEDADALAVLAGTDKNWATREKIYKRKISIVNQIIQDLGGLPIQLDKSTSPYTEVLDQVGAPINTAAFFERLFENRPISFGNDETDHFNSRGEQWRVWRTRYNKSTVVYGEVGFFSEYHHAVKAWQWVQKLDLPRESEHLFLETLKQHLIALRVMNFIYDHFQDKALSQRYIREQLSDRLAATLSEFQPTILSSNWLSEAQIDFIAKKLSRFEVLKKCKPTHPSFDLVSEESLSEFLDAETESMLPDEAVHYFKNYFKESSLVAALSSEVKKSLQQKVQSNYAFAFIQSGRTQEEVMKYQAQLSQLLDRDHKISLSSNILFRFRNLYSYIFSMPTNESLPLVQARYDEAYKQMQE